MNIESGPAPKQPEKQNSDLPDPKRRMFLKGLLGAGVIAVTGGQPLKEILSETFSPEQIEKDLQKTIAQIKNEFDVDLDFNSILRETDTSSSLSLSEKCDFAKDILEALSIYPKQYVANSSLKTVQGVKYLQEKNADPLLTVSGYFSTEDPGRLVINKEDLINYFTKDEFG